MLHKDFSITKEKTKKKANPEQIKTKNKADTSAQDPGKQQEDASADMEPLELNAEHAEHIDPQTP